jgi:hypothetical protein
MEFFRWQAELWTEDRDCWLGVYVVEQYASHYSLVDVKHYLKHTYLQVQALL